MSQKMIIAVDGPAASGKGTLSKSLALCLGFDHLDTGLLYRAVAKKILDAGFNPADIEAATAMAESLSEKDLKSEGLRGEKMGNAASICSSIPGVRKALLDYQLNFAANPPGGKGAVLDGRDIGTSVCPFADLKIWMTADAEIRAQRRLSEDPLSSDFQTILAAIKERDFRETNRAISPLIPAADAKKIDTTHLSAADALEVAKKWAQELLSAPKKNMKI